MSKISTTFNTQFCALTRHHPFPWQAALYEQFIAGDFPSSCNLPTGLGKTAVIPIWLLALANAPTKVPRRLVYVVNRRTVVDQATREAESIRKQLDSPDGAELRTKLQSLVALDHDMPLAISTLRGQFADNAEWRLDPTRPAIIIGTVDMIGSRLLFSGYRCGFKSRPLHAGFLGQDTLLIHDEAHLEPAFQRLIEKIRDEQIRCQDHKPLRVMELSATSRGNAAPFGLTPGELRGEVPEIKKRLEARKTLHLHEVADDKLVAERIVELALQHAKSNAAVLVYARKVEDVEKIVKRLPKNTLQITGTMRGLERDQLINEASFNRFLPSQARTRDTGKLRQQSPLDEEAGSTNETAVYLVCTSAGEVGINLSADHLICDLTPFDSMAQRLGRVNRFGDGDAQVDIVHPAAFGSDPYDICREKTLALLNRLHGNGSPLALTELSADERSDAFSPTPEILTTSDILFDTWALTTIHEPLPGRPPVADYLHGISSWEPPDTYVAWREEVEVITEEWSDKYKPKELLEDCPLKPHELLRDRYDRVFKHVERLAAEHPEKPVWVVDDDEVQVLTLGQLAKRDKDSITNTILLLPPGVGGLTRGGTLGDGEQNEEFDVADTWYLDEGRTTPRRMRVWSNPGETERISAGQMRLVRVIDLTPAGDTIDPDAGEGSQTLWSWFVLPRSADDDSSKTSTNPQELEPHNRQVSKAVAAFVSKLGLADEIANELTFAGAHHDDGKNRRVWQNSIGNRSDVVLAKSGNRRPPDVPTPYRHEFGSLMDVHEDQQAGELAKHAIAAHHGRARPHFPVEAVFDPHYHEEVVAEIAATVPQRFALLQSQYGRWGLAYLESLIRAADAWASANPEGKWS